MRDALLQRCKLINSIPLRSNVYINPSTPLDEGSVSFFPYEFPANSIKILHDLIWETKSLHPILNLVKSQFTKDMPNNIQQITFPKSKPQLDLCEELLIMIYFDLSNKKMGRAKQVSWITSKHLSNPNMPFCAIMGHGIL